MSGGASDATATSLAPLSQALDRLGQRYSVGPKRQAPPGPSAAQWERAATRALRAPDHGGLRPVRVVVVADAQRSALAELFARGAQQRGQGHEDVAKASARAFNGPGMAALVARVRDDIRTFPPTSSGCAWGAALMNLLNALHLMGFGAKALSGTSVTDEVVRSAFCARDEGLASWVIAGMPLRAAHPTGDGLAPAPIGCWHANQA